MPEFLFFQRDHATETVPTPSARDLAALPKRWDLITVQVDGWSWGSDELNHPWFRIISWPAAVLADAKTLLAPLLPAVDIHLNPTTYRQYRAFNLDLGNALIPTPFKTWLGDNTRSTTQWSLSTPGLLTVNLLKMARPPIAIPIVTPI